MLTREQILEAGARVVVEEVNLPALGGVVRVRGLSLAERDRFEEVVLNKAAPDYRGELLVRSLVGEDGRRLCGDDEIEKLATLNAAALQPAFAAAMRLSALRVSDLEELGKGSPAAPGGSSPSTSPNASE